MKKFIIGFCLAITVILVIAAGGPSSGLVTIWDGTNAALISGNALKITGSLNANVTNSIGLASSNLLSVTFSPTNTLYAIVTNNINLDPTNTINIAGGISNAPGSVLATYFTNASEPRVGFYSYVTNIDLQTQGSTSNANWALGPEIEINNINRTNGYSVQIQSIGIVCGDFKTLNLGSILITRTPMASWTNGATNLFLMSDLATNYMTTIPVTAFTETNQLGTNYSMSGGNIGKLIRPLTNSIFLHLISSASGTTNTNTSYLRIAVSQD